MLNDGAMVRLPFEVRVGSIGVAAGASIVDMGEAIPVQRMSLSTQTLDRQKVGAIVVLSRELLDASSAAEGLITRSLRASVAAAVDGEFINMLLAGVTPTAASANPLADLRALLTAVAPTQDSRLYFLAAPNTAIAASTIDTGSVNEPVFPNASAVGGELLGIPMLVSSAIDPGMLILVDASGIAGAEDGVEVDISNFAALEMRDDPTARSTAPGSPDVPVAATNISTYQTNSVAIRAIALFGVAKIRSGGIAALSGVVW
jgi:HK97 family phage major capsid protein